MKQRVADLSWLPTAEEWDFRSVTAAECRVACHWEYERENKFVEPRPADHRNANAAATQKYCPQNYRQAAREFFPRTWTSLTKEQRQKVVETFSPKPVMQVRKLREFFKRMPMRGAHPEILQGLLQHSYVIVPNFRMHGVEAVIREFEKWAREEAKQYPASRRAQAAELPFDALKWLAAARLDKSRRKANVTIEKAREAVSAYWRTHPMKALNDAYPAYASDGAWIKAVRNAEVCARKSWADPGHLLAELA